MTETQRLRKELEKCRARNVAMFDVVEAARLYRQDIAAWAYQHDFTEAPAPLDGALQAYDKAIEKEGTE